MVCSFHLLLLLALVGKANAAVISTTTFYSDSSCQDETYQVGPLELEYASCYLYDQAIGDCEFGECCGALLGYNIHECEEVAGEDHQFCDDLELIALTACRIDDTLNICLSTTPTTACCSAMLIWESTCTDTSNITPPPIFCGYRPDTAEKYLVDNCAVELSTCGAVETAIDTLCLQDGCPEQRPDDVCCTGVRGVHGAGLNCTVPTDPSCPDHGITYQQMVDRCDVSDPVVSPSPQPMSELNVRHCTFAWEENSFCGGQPTTVTCVDEATADTCDQYNTRTAQQYAQEMATTQNPSVCAPDDCCYLSGTTSFKWTCHDDSAAAHQSVLFVGFVSLLLSFFWAK